MYNYKLWNFDAIGARMKGCIYFFPPRLFPFTIFFVSGFQSVFLSLPLYVHLYFFFHSQSAMVPIVVAINKIDRPEADIEGTKRSLMEAGLTLEEIGGEVMCVPISALLGTNVDQLMEAVLTQAELLDLRADPTGRLTNDHLAFVFA